MSATLPEILDIAIARRQTGEPIAKIVADYPAYADELRSLLETVVVLDTLIPVEMPSAIEMAADRRQFLQTVENSSVPVVSLGVVERLNKWIGQKFPKKTSSQKTKQERQPMIGSFIFKASLIFTMIFGSAGGTALAAAQSLPGSPLYPIKLAAEETRLQLANDATTEALLHLNLAQERVNEMVQLAEKGEPVDEAIVTRWQEHVNAALQLAKDASSQAEREAVFARTHETLQQQYQALAQAQAQHANQEALKHAQQAIEETQQQIQNAEQYREQQQEQHQQQHQNMPPTFVSPMPTVIVPTVVPTEVPPTVVPPHPHPTQMPPTVVPPMPTVIVPTVVPTQIPPTVVPPHPHPTEMPHHPTPEMPGGGGSTPPMPGMPGPGK